jgi:hypothetical protein
MHDVSWLGRSNSRLGVLFHCRNQSACPKAKKKAGTSIGVDLPQSVSTTTASISVVGSLETR